MGRGATVFGTGRLRRGIGIAFALAISPWGFGGMAWAEEPPPAVSLEKLLKLPDSYSVRSEDRRAGADATQWRSRFVSARDRITSATQGLDEAKRQLKGLAGDSAQWQASAPGVGGDPGESPLSFKLREQLRERRDELDAAERALRELEVEANLAGVPEGWRYPAQDATPGR